jgi:hypothetical protein
VFWAKKPAKESQVFLKQDLNFLIFHLCIAKQANSISAVDQFDQ